MKTLNDKIKEAKERTRQWALGVQNIKFPEVKFMEITDLEQTGVRRCFRCHTKFMPLYENQVYCRDYDCRVIKGEKKEGSEKTSDTICPVQGLKRKEVL